MRAAFRLGVGMWVAGTVGVRLAGQFLLWPSQPVRTLLLYTLSFLLMALLVRRIFRGPEFEGDAYFKAVALLMLPTLLLDPFSSAFFPQVFPNISPSAAGLFGGWMLICCAGAVTGALVRRFRER